MPLYALAGVAPTLPEDGHYWIAPNATVIGRVELGQDASIWWGTIVRGDNDLISIGARSNIQDGCVLHTDNGFPLDIGADCTIGHGVILHGCTIADNSLIGMGATILNGAKIGSNCIVGANALVTEGKIFPDNSLIVGAPAKVVRELGPDVAASNTDSANGYVKNWRRYAVGLSRVD